MHQAITDEEIAKLETASNWAELAPDCRMFAGAAYYIAAVRAVPRLIAALKFERDKYKFDPGFTLRFFRGVAMIPAEHWNQIEQDRILTSDERRENYISSRIQSWLKESPRRSADTAFTAGPVREMARAIEDACCADARIAAERERCWRIADAQIQRWENTPGAQEACMCIAAAIREGE